MSKSNKVDLSFIESIVDSYIQTVDEQHKDGLITTSEYEYVDTILTSIKTTIAAFIKDANKLTDDSNEQDSN